MSSFESDEGVRQAHLAFQDQDYRQALAALEDAQRRLGPQSEISNDIAVTRYRLGDLPGAVASFREAARLAGGSLVMDNVLDLLETQISRGVGAQSQPARDQLQAWFSDSISGVFDAAQPLSDDEWFGVLTRSVRGERFQGHFLPGFVEPELQVRFVGNSGEASMQEAAAFIRVVLHYAREAQVPLDGTAKMLDFGCGWGRYTRFLLKYARPDNIYGADVNAGMIEQCRRLFGSCNFSTVPPFPPSDFRDGLFDLVLGYSVFSHLSAACADAWTNEFARIVRPGGIVLMTTQGRSFIELCRQVRAAADQSREHHAALAAAFVDEAAAYQAYDAGEFLFSPLRGTHEFYGEALIPRGYIEQHWLNDFELVDFVDSRSFLPQALMVLKRR
jgi:SAM-dependent methyltransferase